MGKYNIRLREKKGYTNISIYNFNYQREKDGVSICEQWFSLGNKQSYFTFIVYAFCIC